MSDTFPVVVADANISHIDEALALHRAEVRMYGDAEQGGLHSLLKDADCLLCRSTIDVNASLLGGTAVKFIATATSGTDHFDTGYLEEKGIAFASAAGSNARSVAEYVFNALFYLEQIKGLRFRDRTLGIIGAGHVGSQVHSIAEGLGVNAILCDPPLFDETGDTRYRPFEAAAQQADILTLHVPLTNSGPYPTSGMVDARIMAMMKPGVTLINAARGGVVDEPALHTAIEAGRFGAVVLDVFAGEPAVNPATVIAADIATPHIAGHAHDGKLLGTQMVYDALCSYLGWQAEWHYRNILTPAAAIDIDFDVHGREQKIIHGLLQRVFDITKDHAALLNIIQERDRSRARSFREYRSNYRVRRECAAYTVRVQDTDSEFARDLRALGFRVEKIGKNG